MNAHDFTSLYTKQDSDEAITQFQNEAGFSLIRLYPKGTPYYKDGRRMFIKVAALNGGLFYGVDMTKPEKRDETTNYIVTDGEEYKRRVTNFLSDGGEFSFDHTSHEFIHKPTNKKLTMNEFVGVLVANHLDDRLFWKRRLNAILNIVLKVLFWLSDKHYERVKVSIDKYHFSRENKAMPDEEENIEPFFKYFYISKNLIFGILLLVSLFIILAEIFPNILPIKNIWHQFFGEFSLSNPVLILLIFLALFSSEKLSILLNRTIKDFLMPKRNDFSEHKENLIERMHNFQLQNTFSLRIKL